MSARASPAAASAAKRGAGEPRAAGPGLAWVDSGHALTSTLLGVALVLSAASVLEVLLVPAMPGWSRRLDVVVNLVVFAVTALLVPAVSRVARGHPLRRPGLLRALAWHAAAALAFSGLLSAAIAAVSVLAAGGGSGPLWALARFDRNLRYNLHELVGTYAVLAFAAQAFELVRERRRRELAAARLEQELSTARLDSLRARVDPHFLFNTLGALLPLVTTRPEKARETVIRLGTLLRLGLRTGARRTVSLRDELEVLRCFLEIEETRRPDRLSVIVDATPDVLDAAVPALVLKPVVEAALAAGPLRRTGPALLSVSARRSGEEVAVEVRGSGGEAMPAAGWAPEDPRLGAAREGLEAAFGGRCSVEVAWSGAGDLGVSLRFPYSRLARPGHAGDGPEPSTSGPRRQAGAVGGPVLPHPWSPGAALAGLVVVAWLLSGLYGGSEARLRTTLRRSPGPSSLAALFAAPFLRASAWALVVPVVLLARRRFPLDPGPVAPRLLVHAALAVACGALVVVVQLPFAAASSSSAGPPAGLPGRLAGGMPREVTTYFLVLGVVTALDLAWKARADELRSARLESRLAQARLSALTLQLHPHFLFNTLNALLPLIGSNPELACRTIVKLGDLLRASLRRETDELVSLRDEIDLLVRYLEIENVRFSDRLDVEIDVEVRALSAAVPSLILQPLVENAIKHGVARSLGPGRVVVTARRRGGDVALGVWNSVPVADGGEGMPGEGIGLANVRARLQLHHQDRSRMEVETGDDGGFRVTIELPYVPAAA